ncbi:nucleotidyltransferase family protein [Aliarcobacter butzleri]|uniref:nucleotidyltransferase family protein n=1 Tax=Aliarcobacter butzleri TaxID=28197 RepID=UPI0002295BE8|nr:nucleotidyltransferase family protein [Aliarcobacter butzleri]QDM00879.1 CBS domain-containing protein [Aliarcobacter butzleri]UWY60823.1 nucleotidyltransferase family protein [Aliarcobacter butzleri]BAK70339.1 nucleotidyl transferase [Aliarcobacter butzleri ED-1]
MKNIDNIKLNINSTIKEALKIIDYGALQIALVVNENDILLGTLTDGDIRRGLLKGLDLNSSIESIIFKTPTIAKISETKEEILKLALSKKLHQIPIVDERGKILGIQEIEELIKPKDKTNKVILMVGGLGTRLRPLTENTPKPMLKVGNKPILQTIVEKFAEYGYTNIIMCVNYKSHMIQDYFGDGKEFGVNIEYVLENQRMGTAGALSLLKDKPNEPFFVMNGDLLTNINFEHLHNYHIATNSIGTMCVREYDFQVPYGVVNIKDSKIISIEEKPTHKFFVSAGIYMLSQEVLEYIPENQFYDMPTLFEKIISKGKNTISFPLREYWLDIGRIEEYKKANEEYDEVF